MMARAVADALASWRTRDSARRALLQR